MPRNATPETVELTPAQELAIQRLVAGETVTESAVAAGVDRGTLHRWLRDVHFRAAFNRSRRELRDALRHRLDRLATDAIGVIESRLKLGDSRAALAIHKGIGALSGTAPGIGSDDPIDMEIADAKRERDREFDRMTCHL